MLELPETGTARSTREHNSELDVVCDWIEGSVLFVEESLSLPDIMETLLEKKLYDNQDFAAQFLESVWTELRFRQKLLGVGSPYKITTTRIECIRKWEENAAHAFCILLSLQAWYPKWARQFGKNYNAQGALFELLTKESLQIQFGNWNFHLTGWSTTNTKKLINAVEDIANMLFEKLGDVDRWANPKANEIGLDVLYFKPFSDNRPSIPLYMLQCASGKDWEDKLKTPDLDLWEKVIDFGSKPQKAFSLPFALLEKKFLRKCILVKGVLLDRYRILAPYSLSPDWISPELNKEIVKWMLPRINKLPFNRE